VKEKRRSVLHLDLDPFFVSVERSLDESLAGRALVIGGDGQGLGFVAAASEEARARGVCAGQTLAQARALCPDAVFRRGDLDAYARASEEVTAVLLAASRRVERPSADEAFVDLTPEGVGGPPPVRAAETIRDELQRRLRLDVSLGLASSRLAARVASGWAKPRGLLVVLPGYEHSFLSGKPVSALGLPPHLELALERAGFTTLGQLAGDDAPLVAAVGPAVAARLRAAARGENEPPVAPAAPPASLQEETAIRDRRSDRVALEEIVETLARRVARRLKPFRLSAGALTVEVRRAAETLRRSESFSPGLSDAEAIASLARALVEPLIDPAEGVRGLQLRLSRLEPPSPQAPLFPVSPAVGHAR
jgi:DNA polymerase IV